MSWNKITCWIFLDTWASMITGLNFIGSNKSAAKKCAVCIMHPKIPTLNLKHKKQHPQCHPQQSIVETILVELGGDHTQNTHTHTQTNRMSDYKSLAKWGETMRQRNVEESISANAKRYHPDHPEKESNIFHLVLVFANG